MSMKFTKKTKQKKGLEEEQEDLPVALSMSSAKPMLKPAKVTATVLRATATGRLAQ